MCLGGSEKELTFLGYSYVTLDKRRDSRVRNLVKN